MRGQNHVHRRTGWNQYTPYTIFVSFQSTNLLLNKNMDKQRLQDEKQFLYVKITRQEGNMLNSSLLLKTQQCSVPFGTIIFAW